MEEAIEHFKGGATSLQSLLDTLIAAVKTEQDALKAAREQLQQEKQSFLTESRRVAQVQTSDSDKVTLDVGGKRFVTTLATLRGSPSPSLFSAMFSGRHELRPDESGCYFFDRDGRHFHDILNYLRDGTFCYPSDGADYKYLLELRAEAEFYGLPGLAEAIDRYPYSLTKVQRASSLNVEETWMYEDGHDEIVVSVDSACQLLGVGLCGTDGAFTAELDVMEVEPDDFSMEIKTLRSGAQSFTKADGQVARLLLQKPVLLQANKVYMLSMFIKGSESYLCEDCLGEVVAGGVRLTFHPWESANGTNEERGQFPELYIRVF
ncbi:hypothetical protein WJX72_009240 [[Myrmecia] bisecta]|uniref:BTB domain-containing protein n=1 Tax=[Myrmecia] bisecta TaxID=41462 RepID=A0AAW1Q7D4_9CHLO